MLIKYNFTPRSSSQACSPLNHFAPARAALPPGMNLLDPLPAGAPQFAFDHPSPNSFAPGMDVTVDLRERGTLVAQASGK
jgi:hypothetical protein